jgi:hypothetical protein
MTRLRAGRRAWRRKLGEQVEQLLRIGGRDGVPNLSAIAAQVRQGGFEFRQLPHWDFSVEASSKVLVQNLSLALDATLDGGNPPINLREIQFRVCHMKSPTLCFATQFHATRSASPIVAQCRTSPQSRKPLGT